MEEEHQYSESSEELQTQKRDGEDQQLQHQYQLPGAEEKLVLQFMDSVHNYLSLFDTVSSTLRQVKAKPIQYKKLVASFDMYNFLTCHSDRENVTNRRSGIILVGLLCSTIL